MHRMLRARLIQGDHAGDHATRGDSALVEEKECMKHGGIKTQTGMTMEQIHQTDHMVVTTEKNQ